MVRKLLASAALAVVGVLGTGGVAFANDCVNLSRPFNKNTVPGEVQGNGKGQAGWLAIDEPFLGGETFLFLTPDNFMNGQGDALLTNATCPPARLAGQLGDAAPEPGNLHGIWSEECFEKAMGG